MINKMLGVKTIESALHVSPAISSSMEAAINLWGAMYTNKAPWLHEPTYANPERVTSLQLPALIASEKARTALIEFKSEITTPTETVEVPVSPEEDPNGTGKTVKQNVPLSDTSRAEFLNKQYQRLKGSLRTEIEYGIAKGGLVIKPYVVFNEDVNGEQKAKIEFDFVQADAFYPLAFDASNNITEAAFLQHETTRDAIYYRLEYHQWTGNTVHIINKAFKNTRVDNVQVTQDLMGLNLGEEIPLSSVSKWSGLQEDTVIKGIDRPLFAYFKMPEANNIDPESPLGVSGFARAADLIKDADEQYSRLLWEYEGGELAVDIDSLAMRQEEGSDGNTHTVMSKKQQRLYRKLDLDGSGDTYQPYAPTLRDASYSQGLNDILIRIEDLTGLSRGTLSNLTNTDARTATELKILKQRSYQTNADIQSAIQKCLDDVIYIMDVFATLYNITPMGLYETSYEWDDSIIVDVDTELGKRITLQNNELVSKVENRMWYFGETEAQAIEALRKIREESLAETNAMLFNSAD